MQSVEERRRQQREYKRNRYHTNPEARTNQIRWSSNYQKRMYESSAEFRALKAAQKKNPTGASRGRPRLP